MDQFKIGDRVSTPIGNGIVISQKMRYDNPDLPREIKVKLDVKENIANYNGTNFPPNVLTHE